MKLVVTEYVTVDGVFEDPGGGDKSEHGGWSFPFWSEEAAAFKAAELAASDVQLLGRRTYDGFAQAWPAMKTGGEFADKMNSMPKYVVSTTLKNPTWNNTTVIRGDVAQEVAKLKQPPGGDILVGGSGQLVRFLLQHDLIDELRLLVHPVIVGKAQRLFDGASPKTLELMEAKPLVKGIVILTYGRLL